MPLNIVKSTDSIPVGSVKIMIYGQPGAGKSTLANTAPNPLTLAFDQGIYRALSRKDSILIQSWKDALEFLDAKDVHNNYDTIIIDTVGKAMEYLSDYIIQQDPKMKRKDGALSLQGFGSLKNQFSNFIKRLSMLSKDIVMLAHDREEKDGDDVKLRPDITGSSYQIVIRETDLIGYLYLNNGKRALQFNPTDRSIGKNCAQFELLELPNLLKGEQGSDLNWIIKETRKQLAEVSEEQKQAMKLIQDHQDLINASKTPEEFTKLLVEIQKVEAKSVQNQLKVNLLEASKKAGVVFSKEHNGFIYEEGKEPPKEVQPEPKKEEAKQPEAETKSEPAKKEEPKDEPKQEAKVEKPNTQADNPLLTDEEKAQTSGNLNISIDEVFGK